MRVSTLLNICEALGTDPNSILLGEEDSCQQIRYLLSSMSESQQGIAIKALIFMRDNGVDKVGRNT
jgi:hypothetical protein